MPAAGGGSPSLSKKRIFHSAIGCYWLCVDSDFRHTHVKEGAQNDYFSLALSACENILKIACILMLDGSEQNKYFSLALYPLRGYSRNYIVLTIQFLWQGKGCFEAFGLSFIPPFTSSKSQTRALSLQYLFFVCFNADTRESVIQN